MRWALADVVVHHLMAECIAQCLGVSRNSANTVVPSDGMRLLNSDPARFEGVRAVGVDEYMWRRTLYGDTYVTVISDVTLIRDLSGPSRRLGIDPGRSKEIFTTSLASCPTTCAGEARMPCERSAGCSISGRAYLRRVSNIRQSTCPPARSIVPLGLSGAYATI